MIYGLSKSNCDDLVCIYLFVRMFCSCKISTDKGISRSLLKLYRASCFEPQCICATWPNNNNYDTTCCNTDKAITRMDTILLFMYVVEFPVEVGELDVVISKLAVADTSVTPKYDDPYEENPVTAKCLCSGIKQRSSGVTAEDVITAFDTATMDILTGQKTSAAVSEQKSKCILETGCTAIPVRSFELSAEYSGFFVPAVTEQSIDKHAVEYSDQQQAEAGQPLLRASTVQATRVKSNVSGSGFYDEPWDLSTVTRSIQEQLCETSQKDVARAVVDNCRPTTTDVYAQPHRGEKRHHRLNVTDLRVTDGPSYGVLCERISDNGFIPPPPLVQRKAGIRSGMLMTDSRPLDDYDVPWDQKKKLGGRTSKKQSFV